MTAAGRAGSTAGARLAALASRTTAALRPVIGFVRPDVGASIDARGAAAESLIEWGPTRPDGPLVWLHGASAGELMGAIPAIAALRRRRSVPRDPASATAAGGPAFPLLVTHFSPSGRGAAAALEPDFESLVPLDDFDRLAPVVAALRPVLVVFARGDVWPGLAAAARGGGARLALINAVVRPGSANLRWPARSLLRGTYAGLDAVGAASEDDAERLRRLGVRAETLRITGDTSYDQALERTRAARAPGGSAATFDEVLPVRPDVGRRLIAGSTWEPDESALLDALEVLPATAGGRFGWQLVMAPHQPTEPHVRRLVGECRRRGHPVARFSDPAALADLPAHGVVIFDEVGRLAELYAACDVAYVGGGLGGDGLHNVLEPASAGLPVLFGPRFERRDAVELVEAGGAAVCDPDSLPKALAAWSDPAARKAAGDAALAYVRRNAGAAEGTADLLEKHLRELAPRQGAGNRAEPESSAPGRSEPEPSAPAPPEQ